MSIEETVDKVSVATQDAAQTKLEIVDGFLVDEDGEIHGHTEIVGGFHITDQASAEWLQKKIMDADATLLAIEAKQRAILANLEAERRRQIQRKKFLDWRYGPELIAFARANLQGTSKTWRSPYGIVSFRCGQPGIEVTDEKLAIAWVKTLGIPDAIKTEESLLLSKCKDRLLADPPPDGHGLKILDAKEKVTIDSGCP